MSNNHHLESLAAGELVSSSLLAALVGMLGAKGILSDEEVREIYENALYLLGQLEACDEETSRVYGAARAVIEAQLLSDCSNATG